MTLVFSLSLIGSATWVVATGSPKGHVTQTQHFETTETSQAHNPVLSLLFETYDYSSC